MTQPSAPHPHLRYAEAERAEARSRADGPWSTEHLRICWVVLLAVGAVLIASAGLAQGPRALTGAAVGIGIVGAFFTFSTLFVAKIGQRSPHLVFPAALAAYFIKIVLLGAVVILLPRSGPVDPRWMAIAVVVGLVGWMTAHLRYIWKAKVFYTSPQ